MNHDWNEVRTIFEAALELAPADRPAYLQRTCGDRPELHAEVSELLASTAPSEELEPAPPDGALPSLLRQLAAPELTGTRVGNYRLGRVLASGGMGVVFEAEQDRPRRAVALKMMRLGFESPEAARRFRFEAEILAQLRHPGIAQVYDTGVHRGSDGSELPWFAMELVEDARSIVTYASAEGLPPTARIELFLQVCDAVQHGHQRGVIHRDLKPDNVLIDASGAPKIIDFGVARVTAVDAGPTTVLTHAGQVVGTLQYMAPEQTEGVSGRVDARTDVHALGLLLFELLTEHHAFDLAGKSLADIAEVVRSAATRRIAAFDPRLGGDLQLIVDKATEKEPHRRYASVAQLADDLRRFLSREPISARPPSVSYQLKMFARRNRTVVWSAAIVLAVAIVATATSVRWALRSEIAEQAARSEKAQVTELLGLLLDDSLTSVLEFERRLAGLPDTASLRRDLLQQAVDRVKSLAARAGDDPEILLPLVRAYVRLGNLEGNPNTRSLGDLEAARRCLEHAHELADRLARAHPESASVRRSLGEASVHLGSLLRAEGDRLAAVEHYRRGISLLRESEGGDPCAVDLVLSAAYGHLTGALVLLGRLDEAQEAATERHAVTERALAAAGDDPERIGNHAASTSHLALVLVKRGEFERALEHMDEAAGIHQELYLRDGQSRERYFAIRVRLTKVDPLWRLGRFAEAEAVMARGLSELSALAEEEPDVVNHAFQLGVSHAVCGDLYWDRLTSGGGHGSLQGDLIAAREHYASAQATLGGLQEAGKLAPEQQALLAHTRERVLACDDQLAR